MLMSLIAAMALAAVVPMKDTCRDDDGNNRCSTAVQKKMRAAYRLSPIESYAKAQVRRIFFVDGYGNDTVALEFVRAAGRDPVVRAHFPIVPGEPDVSPLEKELTLSQWSDVLALSRDFDKQFIQPKINEDADSISVCIHSWVYWGEAIDPGKKPRSVVDNACNDPPVETFAWQAAKMAIAAFPHCDLLDRTLGRNETALLASCSGLAGDRLAAARVFNDSKGFRFLDDKEGGKLAEFSDYEMKLDLQGTTYAGKDALAAWDSFFADGKTYYFWDEALGLNAETVKVAGRVVRRGTKDDGSDNQRADVTMTWEEDGSQFEIASITVGAFRPYRESTP